MEQIPKPPTTSHTELPQNTMMRQAIATVWRKTRSLAIVCIVAVVGAFAILLLHMKATDGDSIFYIGNSSPILIAPLLVFVGGSAFTVLVAMVSVLAVIVECRRLKRAKQSLRDRS
jgi:uncharacterized integral membrane protein